MTTRSRAAEACDQSDAMNALPEVLERTIEVLERVLTSSALHTGPQPHAREVFKCPQFSGRTDVDYFIECFGAIACANEWSHASTLIHLRASLTEEAMDCGRADSVDGIYETLRVRFGMTSQEAQAKLVSLRRDFKKPLHAHAAEITKLVNIAHAALPEGYRKEMILTSFRGSLNHVYLQRHLLAVQPQTLDDAVRAGNEFLLVQSSTSPTSVRQVVDDEEEDTLSGRGMFC